MKFSSTEVFVDKELGNAAVTYVLESGTEATLHIDHALEHNQDPTLLADLLSHKLTTSRPQQRSRG